MGQPDLRAKRFFGNHNDTFADVFNGFIFTDEDTRLVNVDTRLKSEPTEGIIEDLDGSARNLLSDLVKSYSDREHKSKLAILSLENETDIRREIPIKVMGYVYSLYRDQLRKYKETRASLIKEKKTAIKSGNKAAENAAVSELKELGNFVLTPVVVIVLNFGKPKKGIAHPEDFIAMTSALGIPCDMKPTERGGNFNMRTVFTDLVKDLKRAQAEAKSAKAEAEASVKSAQAEVARTCDSIACKMLKANVPMSQISEFTNLSKEHLLAIAQSIGVTPV